MTTSTNVLMHEAADDHSSPLMTMAMKRMIIIMMTTMMMIVMRANFCGRKNAMKLTITSAMTRI